MQIIKKNNNKVETLLKDTNLGFNPSKKRVIIILSRQMSGYHHANNTYKVKIIYNDKSIESVKGYQLLGLIVDKNFELNSQVNKFLRDGYSTLRILKNNFVNLLSDINKTQKLTYLTKD